MDDSDVCTIIEDDATCQNPKEEIRHIDKKISELNKQIHVLQEKKARLQQKRNALQETVQKQQNAATDVHKLKNEDHPWSEKLRAALKEKFKISELRPQQLPTMNATMSGFHCILIMPTGGGKSLCYQLPALVSKGLTLVVSPLLSLMEDQVIGLNKRNIEATMLSSSSTKDEVKATHTGITDPAWPCKLLYVTPERLAKSKTLMAKLQKCHQSGRLARIAIDEVHCCSQWGHDFRTDYKFLGIMKQTFPKVPILGLTATATAKVVTDVQKILNIQGCLVLKASFNRPNLYYEVREKPSTHAESVEELAKLLSVKYKDQSGIIYTTTIKETLDLVKDLRALGLKVGPYHGQMEAEVRSKVHRKWTSNDYQAVVATIAFGMGIDKPDVRFVVHHSVSKSMENFYQESGRAGRDGKPADCVLYWRFSDLFKQSTMVFTEQTGLEKLYGMLAYCIDATSCRRSLLSEHFGERWESTDCKSSCDHCRTPRHTKTLELSQHLQQLIAILDHAQAQNQRLTGQKLVDSWLGKGSVALRVKDAPRCTLTRAIAEAVVVQLLLDECLREDFHFTPYSTISYIVAGPKADAGVPPSPLLLPGVRRNDYTQPTSTTAESQLNKSDVVTLTNGSCSDASIKRVRDKSDDKKTSKKRTRIVTIDSSDEN